MKRTLRALAEITGLILSVLLYWFLFLALDAFRAFVIVWPWWYSALIIVGAVGIGCLVIRIRRRKPPVKTQVLPLHVRLGAALAVILLMGLIVIVVNRLGKVAEPDQVLSGLEFAVMVLGVGLYRVVSRRIGARRCSGTLDLKPAQGEAKVQTAGGPHGVHTPH